MLTHKRKQDQPPGVNLNVVITPMLDMTFQLLFFLVITFKPSDSMEGKMDFNLPATGEARAQRLEDVNLEKPPDSELAIPTQFTVLVKTIRGDPSIDPNVGNISALMIQTETGQTPLPNLAALEQYLKAKRGDTAVNNKDDIKIEAEAKLKYALVIEVMDTCLRAGFTRVGFAPPPDLGSN